MAEPAKIAETKPRRQAPAPRGQPASAPRPAPAPWPAQGQWTYEDWLRLPDDGYRYEVLNGVLHMVPPPTIHQQRVSNRLVVRLSNFVAARNLGEVLAAPCGVRLPGQPVPVQPDILFISAARLDALCVGDEYVEGAPDLVVEILSPSNWLYDRREKFQAYRLAGVPEYWIVDPSARTIEVFVLEGREYRLQGCYEAGQAVPSRVLPGFTVTVDEVFGAP